MSQSFNSKLDKVMTEDQFNQIVEAIISGKYSWACLLILRFAGYNPLHYIPYRTYNRIMEDNRQGNKSKQMEETSFARNRQSLASKSASKSSKKLRDLCYLEEIEHQSVQVTGGIRWLSWL